MHPGGTRIGVSNSSCEVRIDTITSTAISSSRVNAPLVARPVAAAIGIRVVA